jgi:hypothetical protein
MTKPGKRAERCIVERDGIVFSLGALSGGNDFGNRP